MRDFHLPGPLAGLSPARAWRRPRIRWRRGAAIDALKAGGTAADAAIAAVAVLCVVEPHMTGIGGDCFCLIARARTSRCGATTAPAARPRRRASTRWGLRGKGYLPATPSHAVTVPGAVEAWAAILTAHGRFGLDRALTPAIRYAENGFPVAPRVATTGRWKSTSCAPIPARARHYLVERPCARGGRRDAAAGACRHAEGHRDAAAPRAFYEGPIAEDIVATVGAARLVADGARILPAIAAKWSTPIATDYRGLDVLEMPPSGQGLTALVMLNILERFDLAALDALGPERFHLMLEAARLAYAVRDTHIADPGAHEGVGRRRCSTRSSPKTLARRIDPSRQAARRRRRSRPESDTVYLTVVDRDRMAVSLINSLFCHFGVGICTEKTGIMLQNRGACFVLDPAHPNCIGPGKRPMHTIIPGMAMRDGRCEMPFGVMGAHYQPMGHAQVISNIVDYGMDVQQAIDLPRAFFVGDVTRGGARRAAGDGRGLAAARPPRRHGAASPWGGGQAIRIDWQRGVLIGGSDPRKDGCALGY